MGASHHVEVVIERGGSGSVRIRICRRRSMTLTRSCRSVGTQRLRGLISSVVKPHGLVIVVSNIRPFSAPRDVFTATWFVEG